MYKLAIVLNILITTSCGAVQVVQIYKGTVGSNGGNSGVMLPGYLWLYADGTFGVLFESWDHHE